MKRKCPQSQVHYVEDAARAVQIKLAANETRFLGQTADETGVSTIRYWEKIMK